MAVYDTPQTRCTRLANAVLERADLSEYWRDDDQVIVLVYPKDEAEEAGVGALGTDDPADIVTGMLMHLQGIMSAMGKRMDFAFLEEGYFRGPEPETPDANGS